MDRIRPKYAEDGKMTVKTKFFVGRGFGPDSFRNPPVREKVHENE